MVTTKQALAMIDADELPVGQFEVLEDRLRKKWVLRMLGGPGSPMLSWSYVRWRMLAYMFDGLCFIEDGSGDTDTVLFHTLEAAMLAQDAIRDFSKFEMRTMVLAAAVPTGAQ